MGHTFDVVIMRHFVSKLNGAHLIVLARYAP